MPILVDDAGNPLKVYHGSDVEISQFDPERMGERDAGYLGRGFYFTDKRASAQQYGDVKLRKLDAGKVTVANLRMDNPLETTWSKLRKEYGSISGQDLTDIVKADGYDGLIVGTGLKEYVVFDTSQIEIVKGRYRRNYRENPLHPRTPGAPSYLGTAEGVYITHDKSIAGDYAFSASDDDGSNSLVVEIDIEGLRKHADPQAVGLLHQPYMAYRQDLVNYFLSKYRAARQSKRQQYLDEWFGPDRERYSTRSKESKAAGKAARRDLGPVYDYIIKQVVKPNLYLRPAKPQYFDDPAANEKRYAAERIFFRESSWDILKTLHTFYGDKAPEIILQWLDLQTDDEEPVYIGTNDFQFSPEFWYFISRFAYIDEIIPDERIVRIVDVSQDTPVVVYQRQEPAKESAYHGTSLGRVKDALGNLLSRRNPSWRKKRVTTDFANLKRNQKVIMYHATQINHALDMANGFDANEIVRSRYNGPPYRGLFVSPIVQGQFGNIVLELSLRTNNLHGTDYSANIGRESDPTLTQLAAHEADPNYRHLILEIEAETESRRKLAEHKKRWSRKEYPNSFRPYLSETLLQNVEPQAIYRGLVSPDMILRIQYYDGTAFCGGTWLGRKEFIEKYGKNGDKGIDLSSPNYTVDEYLNFMAEGRSHSTRAMEEIIKALQRGLRYDQQAEENPNRRAGNFMKLMKHFNFGDTAIASFKSKFINKYGYG